MLIRVGYDMAFDFPAPTAMVWYVFDPRHNVPRIGRVLMARGRDAADTALTTTFGVNQLASFTVWTDEVSEEVLRQPRSSPQDSQGASHVAALAAVEAPTDSAAALSDA